MKKIILSTMITIGLMFFGLNFQKVEAKSTSYKSSTYKSYRSPSYKNFSSPSRVNGYRKNNGTYVKPYNRSKSDSYKWNNYSSKGNYNPYTGKKGYKKW